MIIRTLSSTWICLAIAGAAAAGCSKGSPDSSAGAGAERTVPVKVAKVEQKDLPVWIEGLGTVAAFQQVTVHTLVDGRLDKVAFIEGQPVKKGDLLAQVDPRPFEVQLHNAEGALARDKAQRDTAKHTYDRDLTLHEQNLIAQQQVDLDFGALGQAEGAVKIDEAAIDSAKLNLDYAAIKSPLDGLTGVRLVDAGNIVHASDPTGLVVITAIDPAAVFFTVAQDRLPQISAALGHGNVAVKVYNRDGTKQLGEGIVAVLDNQINQATATLRLKALVKNPDRALWPNEFVKARMLIETRQNALVVPSVAIQPGPNGAFVYVVGADMTVEQRAVTVALTSDDLSVIAPGTKPGEGVKAGDTVVTEGQNQLRPGGKVALPKPPGADPQGPGGKGGRGSAQARAAEPAP
ncbi:MAG TPA: efflux RND transporter periplasmic adaptor subunit [Kofleriaceae bacterium]